MTSIQYRPYLIFPLNELWLCKTLISFFMYINSFLLFFTYDLDINFFVIYIFYNVEKDVFSEFSIYILSLNCN